MEPYADFESNIGFGQVQQPQPAQVQQPTSAHGSEYFHLRRGGKDFYVSTEDVNKAGGLSSWAKNNPGAPVRVYMQAPGDKQLHHVDLDSAHGYSQKGYKYSTVKKVPEAKQQAKPATKDVKGWQPTWQDRAQAEWNMKQGQREVEESKNAALERMGRMIPSDEKNKNHNRELEQAGDMFARMNGLPTKVLGFSAPMPEGGESEEATGKKDNAIITQSPKPYGVKRVNGELKTQWLMPDGSLTTDLMKVNNAEYVARQGRLTQQFFGRMRESGLNPDKPEDIVSQMYKDQESKMQASLDNVWGAKMQQASKLPRLQSGLRYVGQALAVEPLGYYSFVKNIGEDVKTETARRNIFSTDDIVNKTWAGISDSDKREMISFYKSRMPEGVSDKDAETYIKERIGELVQSKRVENNMPKSNWGFLGDKITSSNIAWVPNWIDMVAARKSGNYDETLAKEQAIGEYGKKHQGLDVVGSVLGIGADPINYIGGGLAGGAVKLGTKAAAGALFRGMARGAAERYIAGSVAGRVIGSALAGSANFMFFEGAHNAFDQLRTSENFSTQDILSSMGRGAALGAVTGIAGHWFGNTADKIVKGTSKRLTGAANVAAKAGLRSGQVAVSSVLNGTIFASPELIRLAKMSDAEFADYKARSGIAEDESKTDVGVDVLKDNVVTMLGFELSHKVKGAGKFFKNIDGGRLSRYTEGKGIKKAKGVIDYIREWRDDDKKNRVSFTERIGMALDGGEEGLYLTKDESAELRERGYGRIRDLFTKDKGASGKSDSEYDGYAELERLMQDRGVSEATKAKIYYVFSGKRRMTAPSMIAGYSTEKDAEGRTVVKALSEEGDIVVSKRFKKDSDAEIYVRDIRRQAELNRLDRAERKADAKEDDRIMQDAALRTIAKVDGSDMRELNEAIDKWQRGEELDERELQLIESLNASIGEVTNEGVHDSAYIRKVVNEKTGLNIDAILKKEERRRTEEEMRALAIYCSDIGMYDEAKNAKAIGRAVMQFQNRQVEVISGNIVMTDDGTMVDKAKSDKTITIRDTTTGRVDMVSPKDILSYEPYPTEETPAGEQPIQPTGVTDEGVSEEYQNWYNTAIADAKDESDEELAAIIASYEKDENKLNDDAGKGYYAGIKDALAQRQQANGGAGTTATEQPEYGKGEISIRNSDGSETRGWITDIVTEDNYDELGLSPEDIGKYEYYVEGDLERLHYATKEELDDMVTDFKPEAKEEAPTEERAAAPTEGEAVNSNEYQQGYTGGMQDVESMSDEELNAKIEELTTEAERLTDAGKGYFAALQHEQQRRADERAGKAPSEEPASAENNTENGNLRTENAPTSSESKENEQQPAVPTEPQTALERVPVDEKGKRQWTAVDSDTAWDALVEKYSASSNGDVALAKRTAKGYADNMVGIKTNALQKAERVKTKPTEDEDEWERLEKERLTNIAKAQQELEAWRKISLVEIDREEAARREARGQKVTDSESDTDNSGVDMDNIPEMHNDSPEAAMARGAQRYQGQIYVRQEPIENKVEGNETDVKFSDKDTVKGRWTVIEADELQPSHIQGEINPMFFSWRRQPKNRADGGESAAAARKIAENINPEEIIFGATAYTGAPVVDKRGEIDQGNNRGDALKYLWDNSLPEQQAKYVEFLKENAERLGLDSEAISKMKKPVLVRMIDVSEDEHVRLGQMTATDTESGGQERLKAKNVAAKLGDKMRSYANILLRATDDEMTFSQLIDHNGAETLKWMNDIGVISNTQYRSAFDSKGNLTAEAKNDLAKVLYESVFRGGSQQLEEMFGKLPAKAQRAILSTAFRDMDSPEGGQILGEIQASIVAYNELMYDKGFAEAKNMESVLKAIELYKQQYALNDRFEQVVPSDKFSNFALHLAGLYKASDMSQKTITSYFNEMYDLAQGRVEATLFGEGDTTQYSVADIVKKVFGFEYEPAKGGIKNGKNGSTDVAVSDTGVTEGERGSGASPGGGERDESGTGASDGGGRAEGDSSAIGGRGRDATGMAGGSDNLSKGEAEGELANNKIEERRAKIRKILGTKYGLSNERANNGELFYTNENGSTTLARIPEEIFERLGLSPIPFKLTESMAWHVYDAHAKELKMTNIDDAIDFILSIINNVDHVRLGRDNSYIFSVEDGRNRVGRRAITIVVNSKTGEFMGIRTSGYEDLKGLKERPLLWARGAHAAPEAVATPTVTTVKAQQGDEHVGRAEGQSNAFEGKGNTLSEEKQAGGEKSSTEGADREAESDYRQAQSKEEFLKALHYDYAEVEGPSNVEATRKLVERLLSKAKAPRVEQKGNCKVTSASTTNIYPSERALFKDNRAPAWVDDENGCAYEVEYHAPQYVGETGRLSVHKYEYSPEQTVQTAVEAASAEVNMEPTQAQIEAGNYKKGHVQVSGFDITIENPAGSVRKGVDAGGKAWQTTMHNTYGYFKGTEGVDGDHIDVFLHTNMDEWDGKKAFVVDQTNSDGTFDEHKVMLGFNDKDAAMEAYLANYDANWAMTHPGLRISEVSMDEFKKWVDSSHRKTKPFADYANVDKVVTAANEQPSETKEAEGVIRLAHPEVLYETEDGLVERMTHNADGKFDVYRVRDKKSGRESYSISASGKRVEDFKEAGEGSYGRKYNVGGDRLFYSLEEAIAAIPEERQSAARSAEEEAAKEASERRKEEESKRLAEEQARLEEELLGFTKGMPSMRKKQAEDLLARKKVMNKDGQAVPVYEAIKEAATRGALAVKSEQVNRYNGASNRAWMRMDNEEQRADEERVKRSGKVTNYMVEIDGKHYNLGKTGYDFAQHVLKETGSRAAEERARAKSPERKLAEATMAKVGTINEGNAKDYAEAYVASVGWRTPEDVDMEAAGKFLQEATELAGEEYKAGRSEGDQPLGEMPFFDAIVEVVGRTKLGDGEAVEYAQKVWRKAAEEFHKRIEENGAQQRIATMSDEEIERELEKCDKLEKYGYEELFEVGYLSSDELKEEESTIANDVKKLASNGAYAKVWSDALNAEKDKRKDEGILDKAKRAAKRVVIPKPVKKIDLFKYVGKDKKDRPVLTGLYYSRGEVTASDARILISRKMDYPKEYEGSVRDKKGNAIQGRYYDIERVYDGMKGKKRMPVDIERVREDIARGVEASKALGKSVLVEIGRGRYSICVDANYAKMLLDAYDTAHGKAELSVYFGLGMSLLTVESEDTRGLMLNTHIEKDNDKPVVREGEVLRSKEEAKYDSRESLERELQGYLSDKERRKKEYQLTYVDNPVYKKEKEAPRNAEDARVDFEEDNLNNYDEGKLLKAADEFIAKWGKPEDVAEAERHAEDYRGAMEEAVAKAKEAMLEQIGEKEDASLEELVRSRGSIDEFLTETGRVWGAERLKGHTWEKKLEDFEIETAASRIAKIEAAKEILRKRGVSEERIEELSKRESAGEEPEGGMPFKEGRGATDEARAIESEAEVSRAVETMRKSGVVVVSDISQLPSNHKAYRAIKDGRRVMGWYDMRTGKVYLYTPNIGSVEELMRTMRHEGIHLGMRELLGQEEFGKLCDRVWAQLMTDKERREFFAYANDMSVEDLQKLSLVEQAELYADENARRAAADEFMAFSGEDGRYNNMSRWQKFAAWVKNILHKMFGDRIKVSLNDVMNLLRRSEKNLLNLQKERNTTNEAERAKTAGRNNDVERQADGSRVAEERAQRVSLARDRSDIRVFEEGLASERHNDTEYSERDRREAESERLVKTAKDNGLYFDNNKLQQLGERVPKQSGESVVYIDETSATVYKVKDPYAKSPMKHGVQPEDAIYEHVVHNLLFPETRYKFEGISDADGDVRIVLSQKLVKSYDVPTKAQIEAALAQRGLKPEGRYSYGNEYVTVTDVMGDNALLGSDGKVYFIDPIIGFKKSVKDVIAGLSGGDNRLRFIGEKGASRLDSHEEGTTRLDNLRVAREMEGSGKDARAIKLATGWERGADGKWRYETGDFKNVSLSGNLHPERRRLSEAEDAELNDEDTFVAYVTGLDKQSKQGHENASDEEILIAGGLDREKAQRWVALKEKKQSMKHTPKMLDDYIDDDELFTEYPELRNVKVEENSDALLNGKHGSYDSKTNTLYWNDAEEGTLAHCI